MREPPTPEEDFYAKPVHLRDVLARLIRQRGLANSSANSELNDLWKSIVPPEISSRSRIKRISDGVVEVAVSNNAVMEQLRGFYEHDVLNELKQRKPEYNIRSIRFTRDRATGSSRKSER